MAALLGVRFWLTLPAAGLVYFLVARRQPAAAAMISLLFAVAVAALLLGALGPTAAGLLVPADAGPADAGAPRGAASPFDLFVSGLKAGLLTFGGAYTVISYLQRDAVALWGWMSNAQFLDGLALSGVLPAPLIIFATFVGYFAGGALGALVITVAIFLPAFAITLVGHDLLERLVGNTALHTFLDGVTAGVVGLIAATTLVLFRSAVTDVPRAAIFAVALYMLFKWQHRLAIPAVVLGAGLVGLLLSLTVQ